MWVKISSYAISSVILLCSSPAMAEVSDKQPSVEELWIIALMIAGAFIALAAWRPLFALLCAPIALCYAFFQFQELGDAQVAAEIRNELGVSYFAHSYLTLAVIILAPPLAGAAFLLYNRRSKSTGRGRRETRP